MKKLLSIILTLAMILTMVPAFGITASAGKAVDYTMLDSDAKQEAFGLVVASGVYTLPLGCVVSDDQYSEYLSSVSTIQEKMYSIIANAKTDAIAKIYGAIGSQLMNAVTFGYDRRLDATSIASMRLKYSGIADRLESDFKSLVFNKGYSSEAADALGMYFIEMALSYCCYTSDDSIASLEAMDDLAMAKLAAAGSEEEFIALADACGMLVHAAGRIYPNGYKTEYDQGINDLFDYMTGQIEAYKNSPKTLLALGKIFKYAIQTSFLNQESGSGISLDDITAINTVLAKIMANCALIGDDDVEAFKQLCDNYLNSLLKNRNYSSMWAKPAYATDLSEYNNTFDAVVSMIIDEPDCEKKQLIAQATGYAWFDGSMTALNDAYIWIKTSIWGSTDMYYPGFSDCLSGFWASSGNMFESFMYFDSGKTQTNRIDILNNVLATATNLSTYNKGLTAVELGRTLYNGNYSVPSQNAYDRFAYYVNSLSILDKSCWEATEYLAGLDISYLSGIDADSLYYQSADYNARVQAIEYCMDYLSTYGLNVANAITRLGTAGSGYINCITNEKYATMTDLSSKYFTSMADADSKKAEALALILNRASYYIKNTNDDATLNDYLDNLDYFYDEILMQSGKKAQAVAAIGYNIDLSDSVQCKMDFAEHAIEAITACDDDQAYGIGYMAAKIAYCINGDSETEIYKLFDEACLMMKDLGSGASMRVGQIVGDIAKNISRMTSLSNFNRFCTDVENELALYEKTIGHIEKAETYSYGYISISSSTQTTVESADGTDVGGVEVAVSGSTATIAVSADALVKLAASGHTVSGNPTAISFDVSSSKGVSDVQFSAKTFTALAELIENGNNDYNYIELKMADSKVALYEDTIKAIVAQAAGADVKVSVKSLASTNAGLNANQKSVVGKMNNPAVFNVSVSSGGKNITNFAGGTAAITVNYVTSRAARAWYVSDSGEKEALDLVYDGKTVTFVIPHCSYFVVEEVKAADYSVCAKDSTCPIAAFPDGIPVAWYHDGMHFCIDNGFISGNDYGKLLPNDNITRAQIVTILWRIAGKPIVNYDLNFKDVDGNEWYVDALRWAASKGIVKGNDLGRFEAKQNITREALAQMLYGYAKIKGEGFTGSWVFLIQNRDANKISGWASEAMHWTVMKQITTGNESGMLRPQGYATRAEVATMIMRFCEALKK